MTSRQVRAKVAPPTPPEKGAFPLDRAHQCSDFAKTYQECLKKNENNTTLCHREAKAYLECRMDRGLMQREPWDALGFGDEQVKEIEKLEIPKHQGGRVAGMRN